MKQQSRPTGSPSCFKLFLFTLFFVFLSASSFAQNYLYATWDPMPLVPTGGFNNSATATFKGPANVLMEATAVAHSSPNPTVYWATSYLHMTSGGSFLVSSDKHVEHVDLAIVSNYTSLAVLYVVSQETLSGLQYTYLQSYLWNGSSFVFQNKQELEPPQNSGGDLSISIDNNHQGNFIIGWQRNVASSSFPLLRVHGKAGKISTSFPYYTLSSTTWDISQLSGTNPGIDSHIYPDASINDNNKVGFTLDQYPGIEKLYAFEADVNFNTFTLSNQLSRLLATTTSFSLMYRPKICFWKYYHQPPSIPWPNYTGNDYAVVWSRVDQNMNSNYDLISVCVSNGTVTAPRTLNALNGLNTIQAQFWDHDIVSTFHYDEVTNYLVPSYEVITEFQDKYSYLYGTNSVKLISRTTMLDNSAPLDEHQGSAQGVVSPNYLVISSANYANASFFHTSADVSRDDPFTFIYTSLATVPFTSSDLVTGYMYSPCTISCRPGGKQTGRGSYLVSSRSKEELLEAEKISTGNALVFPNPAKDYTSVNLTKSSSSNGIYNISIFDLEGKSVKTAVLKAGESRIDLSGIQSGMYLIRISDNTTTYSRKIMITKTN